MTTGATRGPLRDTDRIAVAPAVVLRGVGEQTVLMNAGTGRSFALDAIGTRVWTALIGTASLGEACAWLLAEFDADAEQLRADVMALVSRLEAEGLVEVISG